MPSCGIGIQAVVPTKINGPRGEGEAGAGLLDDILDAEQHVLPDGKEVVPLVRPGINSNVEVERRRAVADKPHPDGFAVDPRVAVEHLADLREDMAQLIRVSLVTQADGLRNQHLIAACPVDDLHVGELGIGHRNQSPVECPDLDGANTDGLDSSAAVAEGAEVSDTDGLVEVENEPGDQVLERRPDGERNREPADAETGENAEDGQSEFLRAEGQDDNRADEPDDSARAGGAC